MVSGLHFWQKWSGAERAAGAALALVAVALVGWAVRLWPEWVANPDLSHGFFSLPVLVLLWGKARAEARMGPGLGGLGFSVVVGLSAVALGVGGLLATVYAVALGWSAGPSLFFISVALAGALGLALALAAGRAVRWIAPSWPLVVMAAVVVLAAPLLPGTYARLTLGLQEMITTGVLETLRLGGIAATRTGNVIHLGTVSVGVEEACSGVRSLISCGLVGLVLSAWLLRSWGRRLGLVALAVPLALAANFGRSLALTLLARAGIDITGAWHDGLGFAVLGLTTLILTGLALKGEDSGGGETWRPAEALSATTGREEPSWRVASVVVGLLLGLGVSWLSLMVVRTGRDGAGDAFTARPDWAQMIPTEAAGWQVRTRTDLERFAGVLQTSHLVERTYLRTREDGTVLQVTAYVAWWPTGAASVSAVAAHTPEACWPGAGWVAGPEASGRVPLVRPDGTTVQDAEQRSFRRGDFPQTVWFWHLVGGAVQRPFEPRSWREQVAVFWRYGVRPEAPQAFVRLSSNQPWSVLAQEALLTDLLRGVAVLGVPVENAGK